MTKLTRNAVLIAAWAALTAISSFAAPLPKPDAALAKELITHAKKQVRTFSRPVSVYHWTHRSDVFIPIRGEVPHADPRFDDYLARRYRSFYRPDPRNSSMAGTGLYAAVDPSSTRNYGGKNWVLYQLEFRKGARFLDVDDSFGRDQFSKSLISRLQAFGCSAYSLYSIFSMDSEPACQALRILMADSPELNIQAMRYGYVAAQLRSCGVRPSMAYLIWGGRDFDSQTSGAFIKDRPADPAKDPAYTARVLLQYVYEQDRVIRTQNAAPYPELSAETASIAKPAENWIKTHLMGCGNFAEDRS